MRITAGVLEAQFRRHGAPLLLKADQGGAMIGQEVKEVLDRWKVCRLMSPGERPSYHGAIEAGIGSLKTRADHESARRDRPGQWTCDDVEAARLQGNALGRPREQNLRRAAIGRALIALGYLRIRRRRISIGVKLRMWKKIS